MRRTGIRSKLTARMPLSTFRTPRCPAQTRSRWPTRSGSGSRTCTWATAPGRARPLGTRFPAAVSGSDALEMADALGERLAHVHMADGTRPGLPDEHLVPGRGTQPCAEMLRRLTVGGYQGVVVLEVTTRRARP